MDYILLLIAGSMGGDRIKSAQTALLVFLKSLPPGCYFNIVGFGSSFALLFPEYELLWNLPGSLEYCSYFIDRCLMYTCSNS